MFSHATNALYIISATGCLAASLWVIYTAMNLINLSIHSTLYGESMRALTEADFVRILTEPRFNLLMQQQCLMETEGVTLSFTDDAVSAIACTVPLSARSGTACTRLTG